MGDSSWLCMHCALPLVNERPWPERGSLADCPKCKSSFTRLFLTPGDREKKLRREFNAVVLEKDIGNPDRWIRGFTVAAGAHKRAGDFAAAKACEDTAVELRALQTAARREALGRIVSASAVIAAARRAAVAGARS